MLVMGGKEVTRKEATLLYVLGLINEAKKREFLAGGANVTQKGWLAFEELVAQGFTPTEDEMKTAVRFTSAVKTDEYVGVFCSLLWKVKEDLDKWPG